MSNSSAAEMAFAVQLPNFAWSYTDEQPALRSTDLGNRFGFATPNISCSNGTESMCLRDGVQP